MVPKPQAILGEKEGAVALRRGRFDLVLEPLDSRHDHTAVLPAFVCGRGVARRVGKPDYAALDHG